MTERLYRSPDDRILAGVAGGVAEILDADPSIVRIVWALLIVLTGGIALLVYIVMAIVVPERPVGVEVRGSSDTTGMASTSPAAPDGGWIAPDGSIVPMATTPPTRRARQRDPASRARGALVAGLILILIGGYFLVRQFVPSIDLGLWWPTVAIGLGVVLVVLALIPSRHSS